MIVYYEEIKRDLNRILIHECRCDERLRAKDEGLLVFLHASHTLVCAGYWKTSETSSVVYFIETSSNRGKKKRDFKQVGV